MRSLIPTLLAAFATIVPSHAKGTADSQNVTCTPYTPAGWNDTRAKIYFYDNNPTDQPGAGPGLHAPTLPANATVGHTASFQLSPAASNININSTLGKPFTFSACNISTPALNLTTNTTQSSCTHGACYITYTNVLRAHPPPPFAALCLTTAAYNTSVSAFTFAECDAAPVDQAQLFTASQQVLYAPAYAGVVGYGSVDFENSQNYVGDEGQIRDGVALAWSLSRADNRTVEVVQAQYTQVGLSARLVMA